MKKIFIISYVFLVILSLNNVLTKKRVKEEKEVSFSYVSNKNYLSYNVGYINQDYLLENSEKKDIISKQDDDVVEIAFELNDDNVEESVIIKEDIDDEEENKIIEDNNVIEKKNGFIKEDNDTYYYIDDVRQTGKLNIEGVNYYFSPKGKYLGTNNIKVIDVSYYQKDINWTLFSESNYYGVILRLGYYNTLDKKFLDNLNELKRLNIPYGIYLFSYSTTLEGAKKEASFTNSMISKYDINPTLGIYYDIESWKAKSSSSDNITKAMYDDIIEYYINSVSSYVNYKYDVKVYSGRWYAMNRLGISKKYVTWVAEYNKTCKYDAPYNMWQYTSKGIVPGIEGYVDISYIL